MDKFIELRNKYPEFIYENYHINTIGDEISIKFDFSIPGLCVFNPEIKISKDYVKNGNIDNNLFEYIIFHIGLMEMISYYKATCSPKIIIKCGYLDNDQKLFFNKLIYNGLGELLYRNGITTTIDELVNIETTVTAKPEISSNYSGKGNIIPVGGGKDSCVSLEILKNEPDNTCFVINPKTPSIKCAEAAGYKNEEIVKVTRTIDPKLLELNKEGFINGHTPFSAIVASIGYLCAYLNNKKNLILSNESSANEPTVIGSDVNHQYSKSFDFENDFNNYVNKYFKIDIKYFSLLRGITEYQIASIFSKYEKYHQIFKSCNLGSKNEEWNWCCNCSKCLFIFIILSPHLYKEKLVNIFKEDLYERKDLLDTFKELIGATNIKPFECVGTIEEVRYAVSTLIKKLGNDNLPYLLKYYKDNYELLEKSDNIFKYNSENNIDDYYTKLVMEEINND